MKYVYLLQSIEQPERFYIGCTIDLKRRFCEHNEGKSIHTNKYKPWRLKTYIAFDEPDKAEQFEAYLKTGNARMFIKKHFD